MSLDDLIEARYRRYRSIGPFVTIESVEAGDVLFRCEPD